eukprot:TRINITY_DN20142_c0_g1_i1.p1 TRINITY_DN20142_c0_g1~~TRINITY_DN20142_c0_g1_i1.p1  ORF type:complete len:626 (+),score=74.75 TRINITY_DN20142_c0_g1_i1:118-1995(+)
MRGPTEVLLSDPLRGPPSASSNVSKAANPEHPRNDGTREQHGAAKSVSHSCSTSFADPEITSDGYGASCGDNFGGVGEVAGGGGYDGVGIGDGRNGVSSGCVARGGGSATASSTDQEICDAFPRMSMGSEIRSPASGDLDQILIQVRQRAKPRPKSQQKYEVRSSADGTSDIPMAVCATTTSSWVSRDALQRSSFLSRCIQSPEGSAVTRALARGEGEEGVEAEVEDNEDVACGAHNAVVCRRIAERSLEVGLPIHGAGRRLLTPSGLAECLDLSKPDAPPFDERLVSVTQTFALFLWAVVLDLESVVSSCREAILNAVDTTTVALALAVGNATGDAAVLKRCYWCVREATCGPTGVPSEWLNGSRSVHLTKGTLCHEGLCRTHLRSLSCALKESMDTKRQRWQTPVGCYTLCQVHRLRKKDGAYPHTYEMRLDHSNEIMMTALREDEASVCRIFAGNSASVDKSEHSEEFLGSVVSNFWGTLFTLFDSGSDVKTLQGQSPAIKDLPLKEKASLCTIGYDTNILGNCPRKVTVSFTRGSTNWQMENLQPRWDKKLNSYALPFFGRVKKASAKNFQLVVADDINTIYLMFGKISKDVFCLDYREPITALDAMAIACAALAKKRAVS